MRLVALFSVIRESRWISSPDAARDWIKFWIKPNGEIILMGGDEEHSDHVGDHLPQDHEEGRDRVVQAVQAGWIRGGVNVNGREPAYVEASTVDLLRKGIKHILDNFVPRKIEGQCHNPEFYQEWTFKQADRFVKTGQLPRKRLGESHTSLPRMSQYVEEWEDELHEDHKLTEIDHDDSAMADDSDPVEIFSDQYAAMIPMGQIGKISFVAEMDRQTMTVYAIMGKLRGKVSKAYGMFYLERTKFAGFPVYRVHSVWVAPRLRGKGIALAMYDSVLHHGVEIHSDYKQTTGGRSIWNYFVHHPERYVVQAHLFDPEDKNSTIQFDQKNATKLLQTVYSNPEHTMSVKLRDGIAESKLTEIERDDSASPKDDDSLIRFDQDEVSDLRQFARIGNIVLYQQGFYKNGYLELYASLGKLNPKNPVFYGTIGLEQTQHQGEYVNRVSQVWLHSSLRGKGLAVAMYDAVLERTGIPIVSDYKQTQGGYSIWQYFINHPEKYLVRAHTERDGRIFNYTFTPRNRKRLLDLVYSDSENTMSVQLRANLEESTKPFPADLVTNGSVMRFRKEPTAWREISRTH